MRSDAFEKAEAARKAGQHLEWSALTQRWSDQGRGRQERRILLVVNEADQNAECSRYSDAEVSYCGQRTWCEQSTCIKLQCLSSFLSRNPHTTSKREMPGPWWTGLIELMMTECHCRRLFCLMSPAAKR